MSQTLVAKLRDLPLSQYILRGKSAIAAAQYEELRRLQEEQAAVTPLESGPFRLFLSDSQESMLQEIGKDRRSLLASLNQGVDVVRVVPAKIGGGGLVIGFIDRGRLRIHLRHESEPPAPGDWRLLGVEVEVGMPEGPPLARLTARWSLFNRQDSDAVSGDADSVLKELRCTKKAYRAWIRSWKPPEIDAGSLVLHVSKKLQQHEASSDELLNDLFTGAAKVFPVKRLSSEGRTRLLLFVPSHKVCLQLLPPDWPDAKAGHWVLHSLNRGVEKNDAVVLLRVHWLSARQPYKTEGLSDDWLTQLAQAEQDYDDWKRLGWQPRHLNGGSFRLRITRQKKEELERRGLAPEKLCAAMSHGLDLYEVMGRECNVLVGVPEGLSCYIRLAPYKPSRRDSDWRLVRIYRADSVLPTFARIVARWEEGVSGVNPLSGDAPALIRDLEVLQRRRGEVHQEITTLVECLTQNSPELSERIDCWKRVCQIERDMMEVGVASLERDGQDFSLVPEEQEMVEEWIAGLDTLNPEGIVWDRYPLKLQVGDGHARLVIRSVKDATPENGEIALKVSCEDPRGRALVEQLCDNAVAGEVEEREEVRLFLPDTQLGLIEQALNLLDPRQKTRSENRGIVGEELAPDDLSLNTLRRILAAPDELEPMTAEWPPLPIPPLTPLSPKQEEAVRAAIFGPDMTLIQGPPGTGKTTVILEILRQLFHLHGKDTGFKVLLVAPTHVAVDNVLERLIATRNATNLVMELGIAPYRVGSTRRIPEHLRGLTPDCLNTKYAEDLERDVARAAIQAEQEWHRDLQVLEVLRDGARWDAESWALALKAGTLPESKSWEWPASLDEQWLTVLTTQEGRVRAWRHWRARGTRPKERATLLQRWLDFLRNNPRFFSELLLANANLVCATTIGCATHPELRSIVYDYVIVDEAGKEEARRLLVPLIRGERWILVGDHQQLPPYADDRLQAQLVRQGLDPKTVTRSLFEELQGPFEERGRYVFLDLQGRMHPDISAFVSKQFYGGRLHDFPHVAAHELMCPAFLPDAPKLLVLDTRHLPDRQETKRGTGYVNLLEQELVVLILQAFARLAIFQNSLADDVGAGLPTIGVIAPYRRQVEELEHRVQRDPLLKALVRKKALHVGTVDSFQGLEKDLIIFSCTRSNPQGRLGFVDNRQRLNVAFSRARCRLIVLADGCTVERARLRTDVSGIEAETRDHLHALFAFSSDRGGVLEVPQDWRTRWSI